MKRALTAMVAAGLVICICAAVFTGCAQYTHIVIASQRLGDYYCSMYEDETIEIVRYLGEEARVEVPAGINGRTVVGISTRAFLDCPTAETVLLPASLEELPAKLFDNCAKLKAVYVPLSVKKIGYNLITDCPEFTTIYYAGTEEQWNAIPKGNVLTDNYTLSVAEYVFEYTPGE